MFVLQSLEIGGTEVNLLNLANCFATRGLRIEVWTLSGKGPLRCRIPSHITVRDLGSEHARRSLPKLLKTIRDIRPQAVFTGIHHMNILLCFAKLFFPSFTLVISERGNLSDMKKDLRKFRRWLFDLSCQLFYPIADHIVTVSAGVASQLSDVLIVGKRKIETIYAPILDEATLGRNSFPSNHPWMSTPRLNRGIPVLVSAGRLAAVKDFSTLLRAVAILKVRQRTRLVLLGDGELRESLVAEARQLGISNDVDFAGFVSDPVSYFYHADCVISTSLMEGLPSVLVQALSVGVPVVATDCEFGPSEFLSGGPGEKLVPVGDAQAVADAVNASLCEVRRPLHPSTLEAFWAPTSTDAHLRLINQTNFTPARRI